MSPFAGVSTERTGIALELLPIMLLASCFTSQLSRCPWDVEEPASVPAAVAPRLPLILLTEV